MSRTLPPELEVATPRSSTPFMLQLLLVGLILPLSFFFLLQAERDLLPAVVLSSGPTEIVMGRLVSVGGPPQSPRVRVSYQAAGTPAPIERSFDLPVELAESLKKAPGVPLVVSKAYPDVARLEAVPTTVADGLTLLGAGLVFLAIAAIAGWKIWRTPS